MEDRTGKLWGVAAAVGVVSFVVLNWLAGYGWFQALLLALLILLLVALVLWILWDSDEDQPDRSFVPAALRDPPHPQGAAGGTPVRAIAGRDAVLPPAAGAAPPQRARPGKRVIAGTASVPEAADEPEEAPDLPPVDRFIRGGVSEEDYDEFAGLEEADEAHSDSGEAPGSRFEDMADRVPEAPDRLVAPGGRAPAPRGKAPLRRDTRSQPRKAAPAPQKKPAPRAPAPPVAPVPPADDLKRIRGIGPRIESLLHGLGIARFAQIAAWTPEDVARIDTDLELRGRIGREDWIGQARRLAAPQAGGGDGEV